MRRGEEEGEFFKIPDCTHMPASDKRTESAARMLGAKMYQYKSSKACTLVLIKLYS